MTNGLFSMFSSLIANTPPYRKGLSSRKFLSLFLILFLAVGNAWGQELVLSTTDNASTASDWSKSYTNVVLTTYLNGGEVKFASKKACGASSNVSTISLSSADSYYFDISLTSAAASNYTLEKVVLRVAGNSTGTTKYTAPLFYSTSSTFDVNNVAGVMDIAYTGYDNSCDDNEYIFPEETKSCRLYRRAKYTKPNGEEPGKVGIGSNYDCSNQTLHITYLEVYLKSSAPATTYTVTYNANGGSGTMEPTTNEIAECSFTYEGKDFVEWNTASDGNGTSYTAGDEVTDDLNLYAIWEAETPKYDVTYDLNGGTGTTPTQDALAEGKTFTLHNGVDGITTPTGKEFAGWSDGTNTYAAGATYTMGAAAVIFTAQWKAAPTVIFDWTAANSSNIEADKTDLSNATYGTLTVGTSVMGRLLGTNTMSKSDAGYKLGNDDVCIEIQGTLLFEEGDEVVIIGKNGGSGERSFAIAPETATAANAESVINTSVIGTQTNNSEYEVVITATQAGTKMRIFRLAGKTMYVKSIKVIRPAQKEILSTDITLSAVTVNTEAISAEDLATLKADPYKLDLTSEYAEAPTIAFAKQTVITYEDATTKTKTEAIEVAAIEVDGKWQAQTEINAITYTVTALIPATYTVIFKDGETELASEIVKVGEHPTAEGVETKTLYALSWKLAEEIVELANVNGTADQKIILTAVWTPKYATSLDFAAITTAGTTGDNPIVDFLASGNMIASNLGSSEWETSTSKSGYVGYKLKNNGATITFLAQADKRVTITFGSIAADVTLKKGDETVTISAQSGDDAETVYNLDVTTDMVVAITTSSGSTVTLKSITIGEIPTISDDATLKDLKVDGTTIAGFNSATKIYYLTVPYGTEVANMPKITEATANHASAAAVIYPYEGPEWTEEYGGCYLQQVVVTAEDGTKGYYHVRTTVDAKQGVSLIKATHTGATTADVTGYIGGSVDKNTQGGGKLGGTDQYFGVKLAEGTFLAGDVVTIYASAVSKKVQIFSDKGTTMINEGEFDGNYYTYTLTKATEWIYLYRTSEGGSNMNPTLGYIEVQRYMAPFIESFAIGEAEGTIDQANKTIAIEVSASADVTALEPTIVAWANGGAKVSPTGAQDFTNPVTYKVSSAYAEDGITTYTVTVTQAAASSDATLKTLTINGSALALVDGVYEYDYELPYGTTTEPVVVAEANDANATAVVTSVSLTEAVITVTAENGATQEYVINFTVSRAISYVIYDGSVQESIGSSGTELINWSLTNPSETKGEKAEVTCNDKYYKKCVKVFSSATKETDRYMTIEVPTGYIAKFYLAGATNSNGNERSLFISKQITGTLDKSIVYSTSSTYEGAAMMSDYQMPGTYYLCSNASIRLYELSVVLYPIDYERPVRQGYYGTICLPNKGQMIGATIYEIAYMDYKDNAPYKIYFDEVTNGKMEAGMPYVFLPNEGYNQLIVTYTAIFNAPATKANGLYGFIGTSATDEFPIPGGEGNYIIQNNQYREVLAGADARIVSNRAYIKLSEIPGYNDPLYVAPAPAPGRKRIAMGTTGAQVATGVDQVQGDEVPTKMIINGQLFILRGEKMYDAQGKLVK